MRAWTRWLPVALWAVAATAAIGVGGRFLLTPVQGDVLVMASAKQPDHLGGSNLELHSAAGWTRLGGFESVSVPAAPNTVTLIDSQVPVGAYDALRLGEVAVSTRVSVQQNVLSIVLVGIADGRPITQGVYAGSQGVSLGLNELSGQLKPIPRFSLIDQFGRPFTNQEIAGHDVLLAAFHTNCHTTCPLYTGLFLQLRRQLPPSVMLIEATTAPDEDTPSVLLGYAGRLGASWTFVTGTPQAMQDFWAPFTVQLSNAQFHSSTLAFIDSHGYIRTYYLGIPDVEGHLAPELVQELNQDVLSEYQSHGNGWGAPQVIDTLQTIDALAPRSTGDEGPAPNLTLMTLDGRRVRLSDFQDRPVLINFWATYCVPCRTEMPLIQQTADRHPKLVVLLVDERDSTTAAGSFIAELKIRPTVLLDTDGKAGDAYHITGLPTTVFVRPDGTIEGRYIGQTNEQIIGSHVIAIGA
jgi:cytochrome oxidase Cu insertion factor (SCO1/SenC/PrrC family)